MITIAPAAAVITFTGVQSIRIPLMPAAGSVTVTGKTSGLLPLQPAPAVVAFSKPMSAQPTAAPTSPIVGKKANGDETAVPSIVITF